MKRNRRAGQVVVIGSANTDLVISVPNLPRPGETVLGGVFQTAGGGKGANQAVSAARCGGSVTFIARVGTDSWGKDLLAGLQADGIPTKSVLRDQRAPSGVALIMVSSTAENCIAVAGGANNKLSPADVRAAADRMEGAAFTLLQLEIPPATVQAAVNQSARLKIPVILNPAPARALPDQLLKKISILTPNESEAEILTGIPVKDLASASQAAQQLRKRGVANVIITLGAQGVWVEGPDINQHVPGFSVPAVDTTAAGDTFNGALAVALAEGRPLLEAIRFANAAAALSVKKRGAQPSMPRRKEIDAFLKQHIKKSS